MLYNIKDFTKELNIYNTIEFKKLDNFDNYFIYEDGRIFSLNRNRFLKQSNTKDGYKRIELKDNDKKGKSFFVHRLIYETFKGLIQKGLEIDHINGIRDDNRLNNLRLLTHKENSLNRHNLEQYKENDRKTYLRKKDYNKQYFKEYKEEHKEEMREYKKKYYQEHKEENQEKYKQYRKDNKDKYNKYNREYYKQNKEVLQEKNKKYREEHREEKLKQNKEYYEKHKEEINRKRREKRLMIKLNKMN